MDIRILSNVGLRTSIPAILAMVVVALYIVATSTAVSAQSRGGPVAGLAVSAGDSAGELVITWDVHPQNPRDYRVSWAPVGENFKSRTNLDWNAFPESTSYTLSGLDAGASYQGKVRARDASGSPRKSAWSAVATGEAGANVQAPQQPEVVQQVVATPDTEPSVQEAKGEPTPNQDRQTRSNHLPRPQNLRVTGSTADSITVAWDTTADTSVTHTVLHRLSGGTGPVVTESGKLTSYTFTGLDDNTQYTLRVYWASGTTVSDRGPFSEVQPITKPVKKAYDLRVADTTTEVVNIRWSNPTPTFNIVGAKVQRKVGSGNFTEVLNAFAKIDRYRDVNVAPDTTYTYKVTVRDDAEVSPDGTPVEVTVTTPEASDIGRPSNLRVTNGTLQSGVYEMAAHDDDPEVKWNLPDAGAGVKLSRKWIDTTASCSPNCPWIVIFDQKSRAGPGSYTDTFIAPGKYKYRAKTYEKLGDDTTGNGQVDVITGWSLGLHREITVNFPAAPAYVPTAPTNLRMVADVIRLVATLRLRWDGPFDAPAYLIQWRKSDEAFGTNTTTRAVINQWDGPFVYGADGNDTWSPTIRVLRRQTGINFDTLYYMRVGTCKTTACVFGDIVFASERSGRVPAQ